MKRPSGIPVRLALAAIRGYQHHLSPHKGFHCAYRCATGRDGCSGYGYRVIERCGVMAGVALLRRRLRLCGETHRRRLVVPNPVLYYQRGDCSPGCDASCLPGDAGCGHGSSACSPDKASCACDVCSTCDPCDRGTLRRWKDEVKRRYQRWQLM